MDDKDEEKSLIVLQKSVYIRNFAGNYYSVGFINFPESSNSFKP